MNDEDQWTLDAMEKYGGSFVKALGAAAQRADRDNLEKIKRAFPEYWSEYAVMGEKMKSESGE